MTRRRTRPRAAVAVAAVLAATLPLLDARGATGARDPSCDQSRRAVAYTTSTSGEPHVRGASPLMPCLLHVPDSTQAGETHLALTAAGTIVYQAQNALGDGRQNAEGQAPVQLGLSADAGRSWSGSGLDVSNTMQGPSGIDNTLYRDPATDRLFWVVYGNGSQAVDAVLGRSDDGGRSWTVGAIPCCANGENPRLLAAPARTTKTHGYPNVLYYCTNTAQVGGLVFFAGTRVCYTSGDGGTSWEGPRILLQKPTGHFPECGGLGEQFDSLDGSYPTADAEGRLYLLVRCGVQTESLAGPTPSTAYVLRSDDEMATWTNLGEAPPLPSGYGTMGSAYKEELRSDPAGNLYLVRGTQDPTYALYLWVSTDHGATWANPRVITIPGSHLAASPMWQIAVGAPGRLFVDYTGSAVLPPCPASSSGCTGVSMYLTVTDNALAADVAFEGAALNTSRDHTSYFFPGGDFTDVVTGPDGLARAAFPGGYVGWLSSLRATHPPAPAGGNIERVASQTMDPLPSTGLAVGLGVSALTLLMGSAAVARLRRRERWAA